MLVMPLSTSAFPASLAGGLAIKSKIRLGVITMQISTESAVILLQGLLAYLDEYGNSPKRKDWIAMKEVWRGIPTNERKEVIRKYFTYTGQSYVSVIDEIVILDKQISRESKIK